MKIYLELPIILQFYLADAFVQSVGQLKQEFRLNGKLFDWPQVLHLVREEVNPPG